jgi:hypothetical protein
VQNGITEGTAQAHRLDKGGLRAFLHDTNLTSAFPAKRGPV